MLNGGYSFTTNLRKIYAARTGLGFFYGISEAIFHFLPSIEDIIIEHSNILLSMIYNKKSPHFCELICDPAGARTQDPILKRDVLYQLSY
jgi:hypothetical protein